MTADWEPMRLNALKYSSEYPCISTHEVVPMQWSVEAIRTEPELIQF